MEKKKLNGKKLISSFFVKNNRSGVHLRWFQSENVCLRVSVLYL